MAIHFHPLTVSRLTPDAAGSAAVTFAVPLGLRDVFDFQPGQFLTLRAEIAGQETRRSYSICSPHQRYRTDGEIDIAIKPVAGGVFSRWALAQLRPGSAIDAMPPDGRFTSRRPDARHRVAFAAGSGITPVLSIIASTLAAAARCVLHPGLRQPAGGQHHVQRGSAGPEGPLPGAARAGAPAVAAGPGGGTAARANRRGQGRRVAAHHVAAVSSSTRSSCADPKA